MSIIEGDERVVSGDEKVSTADGKRHDAHVWRPARKGLF